MRIVQLTPGSGGTFYCENCLRDGAMIPAMRRAGHDALMVPLYLPPYLDTPHAGPDAPVFFGGVNVYLQQKCRLFRTTPRWLDRLFDRPGLLRWVGRRAGMTSPRSLGETTLSMLRGEHGRQVKELRRLVEWMQQDGRPDVVVLSNALLVGLVRQIKQSLGAAVVCLLQDEDAFLDDLPSPYRRDSWETLLRRAGEVDAFVSPSRYYAEHMARRLALAAEAIHVVPVGLDPAGYAPARRPPERPAIGFLSPVSRVKGLETLVEAFARLKDAGGFERLRLRIAGGNSGAEKPFLREMRRRLDRRGLSGEVDFLPALDRRERIDFLQSLAVLSVPTRRPEAFGLFVLEALACGVPVVLPEHGAFPELVRATGGGRLCPPNDPAALAEELAGVLRDARAAAEMGRRGREAVLRDFHVDRVARRFLEVCDQVLGARR